jgi:hypothetical protein
MLDISVRSPDRSYGDVYLTTLLAEFEKELHSVQGESYRSAVDALTE